MILQQNQTMRRRVINRVFFVSCVFLVLFYIIFSQISKADDEELTEFNGAKKSVLSGRKDINNELHLKHNAAIPAELLGVNSKTDTMDLNGENKAFDFASEDYNFEHKMIKLNEAKVSDDNALLVDIIKKYYIQQPSDLPYNLTNSNVEDTSQGQTAVVDKALNQKKGGFYVECGAFNGDWLSNTLFFERYRNWTGILIEGNPVYFKELKKKHRKALTLRACLSLDSHPDKLLFIGMEGHDTNVKHGEKEMVVQCFPFYSILLALNRTQVDYLSLDVEGAEKSILDTIPWNKVDIKMLSIEYNKWQGGSSSLRTYMQKRGYRYMQDVNGPYAADSMFIKD